MDDEAAMAFEAFSPLEKEFASLMNGYESDGFRNQKQVVVLIGTFNYFPATCGLNGFAMVYVLTFRRRISTVAPSAEAARFKLFMVRFFPDSMR
ncbi:hypothetical protein Lfee_0026 [Legionella feeleii]|uniref:Uncharacterized protein n=1 Tax=Legionella feeleii TaxID=453 RepID=A0A0W0UB10_9GAMM|nr:hypothetical protein Lfee_0026 [Legionella feeleii]SPX61881.1 Uncharacterised protein [Legionella feeleii]